MRTVVLTAALMLAFDLAAPAQDTAPASPAAPTAQPNTEQPVTAPPAAVPPVAAQPDTPQQPAAADTTPSAKKPTWGHKQSQAAAEAEVPGGISEDELKQLLVGKELYLRGGYLDDSLNFNEHGGLIGHSPQGSYTLCGVQIDRVRLTRHKVELEGARYGLHFLGELAYEDPTKAVDRVKITPKKKMLRITVDRELVVKPKKEKEKTGKAAKGAKGAKAAAGVEVKTGAGATGEPAETSEADEVKAEIAKAPAEERPADPKSLTTTTSPAHATQVLKDALDKIFARGLDDRMMAAMPDFWKLYYQAATAKTDYRPADPAVLRQNTVDKKARLLSAFEPGSNEYAQANGVAGMALYHTVIGVDGKPGEIAVARPIGFGLDEKAVDAIRIAKFEPAMKDGKPVPVLLDLVVQFRIYSKRTEATKTPEPADKPAAPVLPGPYSVQHP